MADGTVASSPESLTLLGIPFLSSLDNEHVLFPWVLLGVLFVVPFVDPRRPLRLLHLDLLVLLLLGVGPMLPYAYKGPDAFEGRPPGSTLIVVLGLAYLAGRLLYSGFRPRERPELLTPLVPAAWLGVGLVLVLGLRAGYLLDDRQIAFDVGVASVAGAERISEGRELYGDPYEVGPYSDGGAYGHFDTYGPATYLSYVPFELVLPWGGGVIGRPGYDDPDAAHVAAIAFDLLVMLGLFMMGRRVRAGPAGRSLGLTLVYAWASYPYTLFELRYSFNDTLVGLLVLGAFLAVAHPVRRGLLAGVAAATKFAPAVLAPLLATGTGERRTRSWLLFCFAFVVVSLALLLPFLPSGGLDEFWDRTLGYQDSRPGLNSVWASPHFSNLDWLQKLMQIGIGGVGVALAFVPRRRSIVQLTALGAGLMAALALTMTYWFPAYLVWWAPVAFVAFFAAYDTRPGSPCLRRGAQERPVEPVVEPRAPHSHVVARDQGG